MYSSRILAIAFIIIFTVVLGHEKSTGVEESDLMRILEGLTAVVSGSCYDEFGAEHYCVKCIKKGEVGFFLIVLSEDRSEEILIIHVVDETRTIVWQK